jgi:hypothetical protein
MVKLNHESTPIRNHHLKNDGLCLIGKNTSQVTNEKVLPFYLPAEQSTGSTIRLSGELYLTYEGIFTIYCKNVTKPNYPLLPRGTVDINYVTPGAWFQDSEGFDSKKYGKASHKRNLLLCLYY